MVGSIHTGDAWATASAAADKLLGPARVKKDAEWDWAIADGSDCWDLTVYKDGDKVKSVGESGQVNRAVEKLYAKCEAKTKTP
jgi:hypothetical protein